MPSIINIISISISNGPQVSRFILQVNLSCKKKIEENYISISSISKLVPTMIMSFSTPTHSNHFTTLFRFFYIKICVPDCPYD